MRCCVEGAARNLTRRAADEPLGAREHLLRSAAGERQKQDPLWFYTCIYKVGDAVDQRSRLPRSCAGDDEERPFTKGCRRGLLRIELRREVAHASLYCCVAISVA